MNDAEREAIRRMLRERAAERAANPGLAREWLIEHGFYTEAGELKPMYGGKPDGEPEA